MVGAFLDGYDYHEIIRDSLSERIMDSLNFSDAVRKLAGIGIRQHQIYFIDLALLCEMAWSDGKVQDGELEILFCYLEHHVKSINRLAGCEVVTSDEAKSFLLRFIQDKPQKDFDVIREVLPAIRISKKDPRIVENTRKDILNACLDIASSSVVKYPYGLSERFTIEEKEYYHKITQILDAAEESEGGIT